MPQADLHSGERNKEREKKISKTKKTFPLLQSKVCVIVKEKKGSGTYILTLGGIVSFGGLSFLKSIKGAKKLSLDPQYKFPEIIEMLSYFFFLRLEPREQAEKKSQPKTQFRL